MDATSRRLDWARRLQALAQSGLAFSRDPFDIERYEVIRGIAAEMAVGNGDESEITAAAASFGRETGYATPKIDVRGAVFGSDGRLLLVRERSDGKWTLPGGWADVGSSPAENVTREISEEAGFQTVAVKLLAVYDRNKHAHPVMLHHAYKVFFRCEIVGGAAADGTTETDGVDFFAPDSLPPLSTGRVTNAQIDRLYEHYRQPDRPTDFD